MSAEGWISIGISGLLTIVTLLIAPEWVKKAAEMDAWAMAAWTASFASWFFVIGLGVGKLISGRGRGGNTNEHSSRLEDERQRHQADLERLEKSEKSNEELRNLLAAERTLSSSYREKYKDASARLEEREKSASKEERARMLEEDRKKTAYRQWILSLSPDEKLLLLQINRNGEKTIGPMSSSVFVDGISSSRYNFAKGVEYTRVSGHDDQYYWRLTFNEWGSAAVSENMDVLLEAEKYADQEK